MAYNFNHSGLITNLPAYSITPKARDFKYTNQQKSSSFHLKSISRIDSIETPQLKNSHTDFTTLSRFQDSPDKPKLRFTNRVNLRHKSIDQELEINCRRIIGESNFFPEWLVKRKDFQEAMIKFGSLKHIDIGIICKTPAKSRSLIEREVLLEWTKKVPFFKKILIHAKKAVCDMLATEIFKEGEILLKEGDIGDRLYIIQSGTVTIVKAGQHQPMAKHVGFPNTVGDVAVSTGNRRNASVIAETDVTVLRLLFVDYERVLLKQKIIEKYETRTFLQKVSVFEDLEVSKLDRISSCLFSVQFENDQEIYKTGETPTHLYIVKEGIVHLEVVIQLKNRNRWPKASKQWEFSNKIQKYHKTVRVVESQDYFGERELVLGCLRNTRAVTKSPNTTLLAIRYEQFQDLFTKSEQRMLIKKHNSRPSTPKLQQELTKELQKITIRKNALLDASDVNGFPIGRDLFSKENTSKKLEWANHVIKMHDDKIKRDLIKSDSSSEFLPSIV